MSPTTDMLAQAEADVRALLVRLELAFAGAPPTPSGNAMALAMDALDEARVHLETARERAAADAQRPEPPAPLRSGIRRLWDAPRSGP